MSAMNSPIVYVAHPIGKYYQKLEIGQFCEIVPWIDDFDEKQAMGRILVKFAEINGKILRNFFPPDCFVSLAEWRERQIDIILND